LKQGDTRKVATQIELSGETMIMKTNRLAENDECSDADQFSPSALTIAVLAYKHWTERDRPIGSPEEDWFRAERELKHRRIPGSVL
jgi:hypothetical protein